MDSHSVKVLKSLLSVDENKKNTENCIKNHLTQTSDITGSKQMTIH